MARTADIRLTPLIGWVVVALVAILIVVAGMADDVDDPAAVVAAEATAVFDPVAAGEPLPSGYRVGLARDQIAPVYEPEFTTAERVNWPADSLVIGVAGSAEAKAYPVTHLNSREMVIDSLEGIPILVTW